MNPLHPKTDGLYLVDLDLPLTGFRQFISSWIYRRDGKTIVVDPGPPSTVPVVLEALKILNITTLDLILLTHIHLDHAGGTGHLLEQFPQTPVCCHPIGIPHLTDPQKLWNGSLKVLGEIAEAYGPPKPVPADNSFYIEENQLNSYGIEVFETPGHASHHVCYVVDELLFAGEVAGVMLPAEKNDYLRIATPPVFKYTVYRESLLKAANIEADKICLGHYSLRKNEPSLFQNALDQLELWMEIISGFAFTIDETGYKELFKTIQSKDPALRAFDALPSDIQQREVYFCLNSIKGMHDYILKSGRSNFTTTS